MLAACAEPASGLRVLARAEPRVEVAGVVFTAAASPTTTDTTIAATRAATRTVRTTPPRAARVSTARRAPSLSVWQRLAMCESSNNPTAHSKDGLYHGLYQFSLETWHWLALKGDPHDASPAAQLAAAKRLQAMRGWTPWPKCAKRLGLLGSNG